MKYDEVWCIIRREAVGWNRVEERDGQERLVGWPVNRWWGGREA